MTQNHCAATAASRRHVPTLMPNSSISSHHTVGIKLRKPPLVHHTTKRKLKMCIESMKNMITHAPYHSSTKKISGRERLDLLCSSSLIFQDCAGEPRLLGNVSPNTNTTGYSTTKYRNYRRRQIFPPRLVVPRTINGQSIFRLVTEKLGGSLHKIAAQKIPKTTAPNLSLQCGQKCAPAQTITRTTHTPTSGEIRSISAGKYKNCISFVWLVRLALPTSAIKSRRPFSLAPNRRRSSLPFFFLLNRTHQHVCHEDGHCDGNRHRHEILAHPPHRKRHSLLLAELGQGHADAEVRLEHLVAEHVQRVCQGRAGHSGGHRLLRGAHQGAPSVGRFGGGKHPVQVGLGGGGEDSGEGRPTELRFACLSGECLRHTKKQNRGAQVGWRARPLWDFGCCRRAAGGAEGMRRAMSPPCRSALPSFQQSHTSRLPTVVLRICRATWRCLGFSDLFTSKAAASENPREDSAEDL